MARASSTSEYGGERDSFAGLAILLWVIAVLAFCASTLIFATPYKPVFESLEVEIPGATVFMMSVGMWLESPIGMLTATAALALTVAPYFAGARGKTASRRYLWAAVLMFVATTGSYFAVQLPIQKLAEKLGEQPAVSIPQPPR